MPSLPRHDARLPFRQTFPARYLPDPSHRLVECRRNLNERDQKRKIPEIPGYPIIRTFRTAYTIRKGSQKTSQVRIAWRKVPFPPKSGKYRKAGTDR